MTTEDQYFQSSPVDISDADIFAAMKQMQGYIDITPADFMEIYRFAFQHAIDRIARSMTARHVMTRQVVTVNPDTLLTDTAEKMASANISGVPVVDSDRTVVGVISEKDFLEKMGAGKNGSFMFVVAECLKNKGCLAMPIRGKTASDIMSAPPLTVPPDRSVADISRLFYEKGINRVPVADDDKTLQGIVTRADIIHSYLARICEQ